MITKIHIIKDFAVFIDFNWNRDSTLQEFKEKNVIYGWNYSGKTTISRIFSSLRDKKIYDDYSNGYFKIIIDNINELESNKLNQANLKVAVFNKDYIDDNLNWGIKQKWEPIAFDVGENVEIRDQISELENKIEKVKNRIIPHQTTIDTYIEFENWRFTEESKTIRFFISNNTIPFDKGHFKSVRDSLSENLDDYIIKDDKRIESSKKTAIATNQYSEKDEIIFDPSFKKLKSNVNELLKEEPSEDIIIEILENNKKLYDWAKQGLEFEENKTECAFCGNTITKLRIDELINYFSNASKELREKIQLTRSSIEQEIESIKNLSLPKSKMEYVERVRDDIQERINSFVEVKRNYLNSLNELINELERKEAGNIYKSITIADIKPFYNELVDWIKQTNSSIEEHNNFLKNFDKERDTARNELKQHFVAKYLNDNDYYEKKDAKERAEKWNDLYKQLIKNYESDREVKINSLKTITKGQDELNRFIQRFLNREDIKVEVTEDDKFILKRRNKPARNLSEGEKTAIAFSYFLISLESLTINELKRTIIFIDDPVSSLDSNHIAQVYSLINSFFFRKKLDVSDPNKITNCFDQLFISTHNFEFFSFLKDSTHLNIKKKINNPTTGKSEVIPNLGFYLVQRINNEESTLKALPKSLSKYKSEYIHLFELIYQYKESVEKGDDIENILIPNALRRFLEIYTLIKLPGEPDSVENRINELVDDVNEFKLLNHFSHFTTFEKTTKHDELMMNLPSACEELFNLLKKDEKHLESLKKAIGK